MSGFALDLQDIPGNVLAGFNTNVEVFVGLTAMSEMPQEAAAWLASLAPQLTSVADVQREREQMKAPLRGETSSAVWLSVAVGPEFMAIMRPDVVFADDAFARGFIRRAPLALGDRTDPAGWRVNGPSRQLDVFLTVASNVEARAVEMADALVLDASGAGLSATYRETARRISDLEHFGFRDGISQPPVAGIDAAQGLSAGQFVFGYERIAGGPAYLPATDPGQYLRNGSFMVFRRLTQDVGAFRDFCTAKSAELAAQLPGLRPEHLAALLVGRWPSGALATMQVSADPGSGPGENAFDFKDDQNGLRCPFGAHIRKVNPRAGPKDLVDVPRILRRGIPFGPPYADDPAAERGLAFVSFQTSIVEQLEVLTSHWMNSPLRPGKNPGHDLLVGRSRTGRSMSLPGPAGAVLVEDGGRQWITPTGGGYLFAPGRSALARIAKPLATGVGWRAQRLLMGAKSLLKDMVGR